MRLEDRMPALIIEDLDRVGAYLDIDKLRDDAEGVVGQDAEDACTYNHNSVNIIDKYEDHVYSDPDSYMGERTYKADEWEEAQRDYAIAIAASVLSGLLSEAIDDLETVADNLLDWAKDEGASDDLTIDEAVMVDGYSCPHGWASHDEEDSTGGMIWRRGQLDGLNGVAVKAAGVWLSVLWDPNQEREV